MPKRCIDYSKTAIYKLVCDDIEVNEIYVGHTTNFVKRKYNHRNACRNPNHSNYNCFVNQFIRSNGGFKNWSVVEIEKYPCNDLQEAFKRERFWMEKLKATLNRNVPGRTMSEYHHQNKEKLSIYKEQYYRQNRDKVLSKANEKIMCGCGVCFTVGNRSRHIKSNNHQRYLNRPAYEYFWEDGTPCSKEEYEQNLQY